MHAKTIFVVYFRYLHHKRALGFSCAKTRFVPIIREVNKVHRLDFATDVIKARVNFDDIIFTDESSFQTHGNNQISTVKIVRDEFFKVISREHFFAVKPKHPAKVHLWGGISRRGPTDLLIFDGIMDRFFYTEKILRDTYLPSAKSLYPEMTPHMWADNDPKHASKHADAFIKANPMKWFRTPAESPDINPIEHVWHALKVQVAEYNPETVDELCAAIIERWEAHLTVEQCNRYIDHNFKALDAVVAAKGGYTGM